MQNAALPLGPVGREFSGVARLVVTKDRDASLMRGYMEQMSKLRTRFNTPGNEIPVVKDAASEARYRTAAAISFAWPNRPIGCCEASHCRFSEPSAPANRSIMSVAMAPGATAFTRMP